MGGRRPDHDHVLVAFAHVRVLAVCRRRSGPDVLGDAADEVVLELDVVLVGVAVAIPDDAPVDAVLTGPDVPDEEPLLVPDVRDGYRLDAEEDEDLVEGGEVGDEVGEDGRDPGDELRVDEANPADADDAQAGAEAEEPVD